MKRLKDPIYGYIEIDGDVFEKFIDTPAFQRLRRVVQTSYGPLYPAASHNRFIHSLGVYYLGGLAAQAVGASLSCLQEDPEFALAPEKVEEKLATFKVACLLHDLGHAPFSHAGEQFYDVASDSRTLDDQMKRAVNDQIFSKSVDKMRSVAAAPHERMSVILGLDLFGASIPDKALFARCITGYVHDEGSFGLGLDEQIDNILVRLLNSTTIDVDKLDYLIRDSFVVGFESTSIDYRRLLKGIEIKRTAQAKYELVYHSSAISVLENVIYARDFEKKWIQSHPVIIYDQFLIQNAMKYIDKKLCRGDAAKTLFCEESLKESGKTFADDVHISLLCDDDAVYLAKNKYPNSFMQEYFDRNDRRHPVWKSEAEYKALFDEAGCQESLGQLVSILHSIESEFCEGDLMLDQKLVDRVQAEIGELDTLGEEDGAACARKRNLERINAFLSQLKEQCSHIGIIFDFVVIFSKGFTSGFNPDDFRNTLVSFPDCRDSSIFKLDDVSSCLKGEAQSGKRELFYLYHRHANAEDFPRAQLVRFLKESQR